MRVFTVLSFVWKMQANKEGQFLDKNKHTWKSQRRFFKLFTNFRALFLNFGYFVFFFRDNGSINSKRTNSPPGICRAFFHFSISHGGHLPKKVRPGMGHCQKNSNFRPLEEAYGSSPTCTNICTIVSTCERRMTKRRTCKVRKKKLQF